MQGNGGLYPFILNTHITSTLLFYLHSTANLPAARNPSVPSKYKAKFAHIGEEIGLSVFNFWIAACESSTFFRYVRPCQQVHISEAGIVSNTAVETSSLDR